MNAKSEVTPRNTATALVLIAAKATLLRRQKLSRNCKSLISFVIHLTKHKLRLENRKQKVLGCNVSEIDQNIHGMVNTDNFIDQLVLFVLVTVFLVSATA